MKKAIFRKFHSRRAFTLTEMLITLLIAAIAAAAVAVGVSSAVKVHNTSIAISEGQTVLSTITQVIMDELRFASDIDVRDGKVYFTSKNYGANSVISTSKNGCVVINNRKIIPDNAYVGFSAVVELAYDGSGFSVTVVVSKDSIQSDAQFYVRPLGN